MLPHFIVYNISNSRRVVYYGDPNQSVDDAIIRHQQATTPLEVAVCLYDPCPVDSDDDNDVEFSDYAILVANWLKNDCTKPDWCSGADLNYSGAVDHSDLLIFVKHWLSDCCTQ